MKKPPRKAGSKVKIYAGRDVRISRDGKWLLIDRHCLVAPERADRIAEALDQVPSHYNLTALESAVDCASAEVQVSFVRWETAKRGSSHGDIAVFADADGREYGVSRKLSPPRTCHVVEANTATGILFVDDLLDPGWIAAPATVGGRAGRIKGRFK